MISYFLLAYTTTDIPHSKTKNDKVCQTPIVFWINTVLNYIVIESGESNDAIGSAFTPGVSALPYSILF